MFHRTRRAFTLIELLVVIAIITILIAIMIPTIEKSVERSRLTVCGENLHVIGAGIHMYAAEFNDALPLGPATPSTLDPSRNFNTVGDSLMWSGTTSRNNGLGLLTQGWCNNPKAFLCPFNDDPQFAADFKANLNKPGADAYSSYMYRQLDQTEKSRLTNLGNNGLNKPAKALLMDWQSEGPAPYRHTSHDDDEYLNVLYIDGHVQSYPNTHDALVVDTTDFAAMPASYVKRLDRNWVKADFAETGALAAAPTLP